MIIYTDGYKFYQDYPSRFTTNISGFDYIYKISNGGTQLSNYNSSNLYDRMNNNSISIIYSIGLMDKPSAYDGVLLLIKIDNSFGRIIYFSNDAAIYYKCLSNKWGNWKQFNLT